MAIVYRPRKTPRECGPKPLPSRGFRPYRDSFPERLVSQWGPQVVSRLLKVRAKVAPESASTTVERPVHFHKRSSTAIIAT
jgi:hypothetical protein